MIKPYANRPPTSLLRRRSFLAVNAAVFVLMLIGFTGEYLRNRDMRQEITRLEGSVQQMEQKNFELARLGQRFGTDAMLEREARLNLGLQKPGESVIILRDATPASAAVTIENGPSPTQESARPGPWDNARKWWRHFFRDKQRDQVRDNANNDNQQAL